MEQLLQKKIGKKDLLKLKKQYLSEYQKSDHPVIENIFSSFENGLYDMLHDTPELFLSKSEETKSIIYNAINNPLLTETVLDDILKWGLEYISTTYNSQLPKIDYKQYKDFYNNIINEDVNKLKESNSIGYDKSDLLRKLFTARHIADIDYNLVSRSVFDEKSISRYDNIRDIVNNYYDYFSGKSDIPGYPLIYYLYDDTLKDLEKYKNINNLGFITVDSQGGLIRDDEDNIITTQRAYIRGFMPNILAFHMRNIIMEKEEPILMSSVPLSTICKNGIVTYPDRKNGGAIPVTSARRGNKVFCYSKWNSNSVEFLPDIMDDKSFDIIIEFEKSMSYVTFIDLDPTRNTLPDKIIELLIECLERYDYSIYTRTLIRDDYDKKILVKFLSNIYSPKYIAKFTKDQLCQIILYTRKYLKIFHPEIEVEYIHLLNSNNTKFSDGDKYKLPEEMINLILERKKKIRNSVKRETFIKFIELYIDIPTPTPDVMNNEETLNNTIKMRENKEEEINKFIKENHEFIEWYLRLKYRYDIDRNGKITLFNKTYFIPVNKRGEIEIKEDTKYTDILNLKSSVPS